MKPAGNPWMKFYPSDWRSDPALRSCTIAARGLWIEMMAIMHEAEPYGSLLVKGKRVDKKQLAALVGVPERECTVLLLELEGFGVFARDADGTIYSRRMRRDHARAEEGRKQVSKRWSKKDTGHEPTTTPNRSDDRVATTQKPEARSQTEDEIVPRGGAFTSGSKALTHSLWRALGIESPLHIPPELAGADWRAIEWERAGWTGDLIEVECRRIGPGKPLVYYEKVFATAFAKRSAPLPTVEIRQAETITVTHGKPKSAIIQAADDLVRTLASFDGPARGPDELRGPEGEAPPRLLSHG